MGAIKPRTARVVIYQGDDLQHLSDLDHAVEETEQARDRAERQSRDKAPTGLLGEVDLLTAARAAYDAAVAERDAFAAQADERGVVVVLNALPRLKWRQLFNEHGPRDGNDDDKVFGVNMETMPDALIPASVDREASTIDGDVEEFLESLSDYDYYDRLFVTAFALNRGSAVADPTRRLGSAPSQTSSATSN